MNLVFNEQFSRVYSRKQDNDKYNKWCKEYVRGVDLSKIEWKSFNYDELMRFYYRNYFDDDYQSFVMERDEYNNFLPFGMKYLTINPTNTREQYILGLCENNGGTKTIVACIIYDPCYVFDADTLKPVTYIKTVETNGFFQNKGVFNEMCKKLISFINKSQDIIITPEDSMGKFIHVIKHINDSLKDNGFQQEVICEYDLTEKYFETIKR